MNRERLEVGIKEAKHRVFPFPLADRSCDSG
jgi:hypothetical protein